MSDAASLALGTVILGALLGGVVQALIAWQTRDRRCRAAAMVVLEALDDAQIKAARTEMHPFTDVYIDFAAYVSAWDQERRDLAAKLQPEDYRTVAKAFSAMRRLAKMETQGRELREEVFSELTEVVQVSEFARRALWPHTRTRRFRLRRWFELKLDRVRTRWGHVIVSRRIRKVLKAEGVATLADLSAKRVREREQDSQGAFETQSPKDS